MRCRGRFLSLVLITLVGLTAGCSYIHFGRLDRIRNDSALAAENSDLRIERKLLKEELEIARKEREILSAAVDRSPRDGASEELVAKLAATNQELAALRENYARLKAEREQLKPTTVVDRIFRPAEAPPNQQIAGLREQLGRTEERLADALRTHAELQGENTRLRSELEKVHSENAALATKVAQLSMENHEAQTALAQLNSVLVAQKEANARAEQAADDLRRQAIPAPAPTPTPSPAAPATAAEPALSLASARESSADAARELVPSPQSGTIFVMMSASSASTKRTEKSTATTAEPASPSAAASAESTRTYTVREGDSLEAIAERVYGRRDRWIILYAANNALLSDGRPLTPGMTLKIPNE